MSSLEDAATAVIQQAAAIEVVKTADATAAGHTRNAGA